MLIFISLYIGTFFSPILARFGLDFRPCWASFLLQNHGQIDVVFSLVFGTDFSLIFYQFYKNVDMTIILRKCIWTRILRVQMHVGLVGMTSLIYPKFATTGLEIQQFVA